MLCNAYDDMSNFSARSKHQRCYNPSPLKKSHPEIYNLELSNGKRKCVMLTHHNFIQKASEGVFHSVDKRDKLQYRQGIATR